MRLLKQEFNKYPGVDKVSSGAFLRLWMWYGCCGQHASEYFELTLEIVPTGVADSGGGKKYNPEP